VTEPKEGAIVTTEPVQQALEVGDYRMTPDQVALIKRTIAKDCSDDELKLFVHVCRRLRLDPIAKQIYAVKMDGKMVIQTGIDGFRLIAERTGKYRGASDPEWCGEDGAWKEVWTDMEVYPRAARVRVKKQGPDDLEPIIVSGVANFTEYVAMKGDEPNARWKKAPAAMLAKCAEALALRRAFPEELSGLFSFDEMSSSYDKGPSAPKVALPQRKSERVTEGDAPANFLPEVNPWVGDLDDIKKSESAKLWALHAEQGGIRFLTEQEEIKDRAAEAMSNAKQVRIEWVRAKAGHAKIETLVSLQDA
jgi:phage recombination protein Bet